MEIKLSPVEQRILGVLIEKEMSTPDYYPMTFNALINACNQKTNRAPVMNLNDADVESALNTLRGAHLVWQIATHGSRVPKYEHNLKETADFSRREQAIICELLLRGPQTPGELRSRTTRLIEFESLPEVEFNLQKLMNHEKGPFVTRLPRLPGRKEHRFAHLFGDIDEAALQETPYVAADGPARTGTGQRMEALEERVEELTRRLDALQEAFETFKRQFE